MCVLEAYDGTVKLYWILELASRCVPFDQPTGKYGCTDRIFGVSILYNNAFK